MASDSPGQDGSEPNVAEGVLKELEHVRLVHFTLVVGCATVLYLTSDAQREVGKVVSDLEKVRALPADFHSAPLSALRVACPAKAEPVVEAALRSLYRTTGNDALLVDAACLGQLVQVVPSPLAVRLDLHSRLREVRLAFGWAPEAPPDPDPPGQTFHLLVLKELSGVQFPTGSAFAVSCSTPPGGSELEHTLDFRITEQQAPGTRYRSSLYTFTPKAESRTGLARYEALDVRPNNACFQAALPNLTRVWNALALDGRTVDEGLDVLHGTEGIRLMRTDPTIGSFVIQRTDIHLLAPAIIGTILIYLLAYLGELTRHFRAAEGTSLAISPYLGVASTGWARAIAALSLLVAPAAACSSAIVLAGHPWWAVFAGVLVFFIGEGCFARGLELSECAFPSHGTPRWLRFRRALRAALRMPDVVVEPEAAVAPPLLKTLVRPVLAMALITAASSVVFAHQAMLVAPAERASSLYSLAMIASQLSILGAAWLVDSILSIQSAMLLGASLVALSALVGLVQTTTVWLAIPCEVGQAMVTAAALLHVARLFRPGRHDPLRPAAFALLSFARTLGAGMGNRFVIIWGRYDAPLPLWLAVCAAAVSILGAALVPRALKLPGSPTPSVSSPATPWRFVVGLYLFVFAISLTLSESRVFASPNGLRLASSVRAVDDLVYLIACAGAALLALSRLANPFWRSRTFVTCSLGGFAVLGIASVPSSVLNATWGARLELASFGLAALLCAAVYPLVPARISMVANPRVAARAMAIPFVLSQFTYTLGLQLAFTLEHSYWVLAGVALVAFCMAILTETRLKACASPATEPQKE